jgi:hypothetical protein
VNKTLGSLGPGVCNQLDSINTPCLKINNKKMTFYLLPFLLKKKKRQARIKEKGNKMTV